MKKKIWYEVEYGEGVTIDGVFQPKIFTDEFKGFMIGYKNNKSVKIAKQLLVSLGHDRRWKEYLIEEHELEKLVQKKKEEEEKKIFDEAIKREMM